MEITVNGKKMECCEGRTALELLSELGVAPERTVVELRGEIVPRDRLCEALICSGDKVEIIRFVGGG